MIRKSILYLVAGIASILCGVMPASAQEPTVTWRVSQGETNGNSVELVFLGKIKEGWHTYGTGHSMSPTTVEFAEPAGYRTDGAPKTISNPSTYEGDTVYFSTIKFVQKILLQEGEAEVKGTITSQSCMESACGMPEDWEFSLQVKAGNGNEAIVSDGDSANRTAIPDPESETSGNSIWGLILEAVLWGFAMLLTPCVFPMIPMTISFFMKGSSSPAAGRFKAFMYGLFIVLLYTVPISIIIGATWLVGGETVTADIFNWLATHWLPNLIFFVIFMVFAASFFGAFEITLPSSLVNKSDKNSDKGGLAGIFFMALTLVLVSFSCTGPIVGSVLIKSTQGEFWTPMITMLAFSVAFALPFTIFAMFPSLLKKLKSGSWLNSVKVVLGFIEVALGFKFLSLADQTYHWGLLDREVYLAIWIVVFTLLGLYLLGKIRFEADSEVKHIGVFRLTLSIVVFSFVVYMIPGMFGAPLKALSGYLPPIETQDFVIWSKGEAAPAPSGPALSANESEHTLPLGLTGFYSLEDGLQEAQKTGKPVFVDISGLACVNCREMEQRVWSDQKVLSLLKNEFVIVVLYTDDKAKLPESKWVTTESGKVLKDKGRVNSYFVRKTFGVNAQPNYVVLSPYGERLSPVRGYNLDVDEYVKFLQDALAKKTE